MTDGHALLADRIRRDGRNLGGGILKVDGFINDQVDPRLTDACGRELARRFAPEGATILGLARLANAAGARIVGVGALVEKAFEGGRLAVMPLAVPVEALVRVLAMDGDSIVIEEEA